MPPMYEYECENEHRETKLMGADKALQHRNGTWPAPSCAVCGKPMKQIMSAATVPPSRVQR